MNKRYWLRGGIIASVLGVLLSLLSFKIPVLNYFASPGIGGFTLADVAFGCKWFYVWERPSEPTHCIVTENALALVAIIITYFIIGMLIGWIYGKIKNRSLVRQ